ncbi:MAG: cytochrome bc complex cytochrome b subunit [Chloroflexota bacterium]|nr:MAG: cytochrome bc complex cytochrome b subunit [Chloroflexota bacterium]
MQNEQSEQSESSPIPMADWVDDRYRIRDLLGALLHVDIPKSAKTFYFGGITLFLFIVQVITGSLLTLYYQPSEETAYESVLLITSSVNFGWLIRSIHSWGANLMIIFTVLHLLRIFFQGVYKRPRELTWAVGIGLLAITLAFGFTGYLLPWDQRAYWATTVGSESAGAVPFIGEYLLLLMRGGEEISGATLSRFFGVHTLLLPLTLALLVTIHLVLIHQQGIANPRKRSPSRVAPPESQEEQGAEEEKKVPFFPHYVLSELIAWYVILGVLIVLASMFPVGLEEQADPLQTPPHIKPEWYFLSLYQLLKYVPRTFGVLLGMLALPMLLLLPFIDRGPDRRPRARLFIIITGLVALTAVVGLTIWGWFS